MTDRSLLLIAGAAGTIGRALCAELARGGVAFDVLSSRADAALPAGATRVRVGDYARPDMLAAAFEGVDTLFLVLPLVPGKRDLARHVAAAARAAGVRRIVRASGAGADPASPYALPRLQGEVDAILETSGAACTFLLNAGFMQNDTTFGAAMVRAGSIVAATGDQPQSLVDVRDIAAVAATVLRDPAAHAGQRYTLTGGEALTDSQRAAVYTRVLGRPVTFQAMPVDTAERQMREAWHLPEPMVEALGSLNRLISAGHAARVSPDVERLLGREPLRFEAFVRDHRAAWD